MFLKEKIGFDHVCMMIGRLEANYSLVSDPRVLTSRSLI